MTYQDAHTKSLSGFIPLFIDALTLFTARGDSSSSNDYGNGNGQPAEDEIWMENTSFNPEQKT